MRLEKPALSGPLSARRGWWPAIMLVVGVLVAGLLIGGHLLLWALSAMPAALPTLIAAPAMFLLPGLALLRLLWPEALAPAERWPLAIGISCALPPLLLLLSALVGLRWNSWLCWGELALSVLVLVWPRRAHVGAPVKNSFFVIHEAHEGHEERHSILRDLRGFALLGRGSRTSPTDSAEPTFGPDRRHLLLIGLTLATVIVRLYAARDLPAGLWGDSYQHTIIAQLLVDHGGLFTSWLPYAQLTTFTYHYGFHSNVAWLHWLSGEPVTRGLLVVGQLQSALAVPLVYLLTRRLLGNERAGLWAALIVGFVSTMPAYYLNWGRYTQLAGQTVLPAVCIIWMALLETSRDHAPRRDALPRLVALAVIVTAGMALTHYRVAVFAACFVLAYAAYLLLARVRAPRDQARLVGVGLAASAPLLLLLAPWLIRLREGALLRLGGFFLSTNIGTDLTNNLPTTGELFSLHMKLYLVIPALAGVALLIGRRRWRGLVLPAWAALLWLAANPYLVGLPGAGIISNFTVVIANYLVLAPLAGYALAEAWDWLAQRPRAPIEYSESTKDMKITPESTKDTKITKEERVSDHGGDRLQNSIFVPFVPLKDTKITKEERVSDRGGSRLQNGILVPLVSLVDRVDRIRNRFASARLANWGALLAGALVLLWGLSWQQRIADPRFQLFTPADAEAMDWIRREAPPDAKFFVNSFPAFGDTLYAGSDGGWWLPFMTGRQSDLPPLTYGLEAGAQPSYQFAVNAEIAAVERHPLTSPAAADALRRANYRYLYDGPAASPPQEYIDPAALAASPLYELVYSQGGVTIWRVR